MINHLGDDELKNAWNSFWNSKSKEDIIKIRPRQKKTINILNRYVHSEMTICDAGCGSGFYSNYFISKRCSTYCIDYSEKAIELAKKVTLDKAERYIIMDILNDDNCRELRNTFDLIYTDGLFEHFSIIDQRKLMGNLIAMKKENGIIITFVPNILTYWEPIRRIHLNMPGIKEKPFTMKMLTSLVEKSGQKIIEKGGIHVLPFDTSPEILARWIGSSIYVVSM